MSQSNYGMGIPFNMESVLAQRGANLIFCPKDSKPKRECAIIIDNINRLVTGATAFEAQGVSEEIVNLLQTKK